MFINDRSQPQHAESSLIASTRHSHVIVFTVRGLIWNKKYSRS